MSGRAIRGAIVINDVLVPIKVYVAASDEKATFKSFGPNGEPLKQVFINDSGDVVPYNEVKKGYEISKNNYVFFSKEEINSFGGEKSPMLNVIEFVPSTEITPLMYNKAYYLKPDKGGQSKYVALSKLLMRRNKVAIGHWNPNGKQHLVAIQPHNGGLVMYCLYYKNEVRDFEDNVPNNCEDEDTKCISDAMTKMSHRSFSHSKYFDSYSDSIHKVAETRFNNRVKVSVFDLL